MTYKPKVDDYVKWAKGIEGWVYFQTNEYVTIEASVKPKDSENYEACCLHKNERLLVLCYRNQWNELEYVKSRESKFEEENCLEIAS